MTHRIHSAVPVRALQHRGLMLSSYISLTVIDGGKELTFQAVQGYNKKKTAGES